MNEQASIAELSEELQRDGKQIRAYLRSKFARSVEAKNSRWGDAKKGYVLTKTQTSAVRERFARKSEDESEAA